jgi:hypothetical protein
MAAKRHKRRKKGFLNLAGSLAFGLGDSSRRCVSFRVESAEAKERRPFKSDLPLRAGTGIMGMAMKENT